MANSKYCLAFILQLWNNYVQSLDETNLFLNEEKAEGRQARFYKFLGQGAIYLIQNPIYLLEETI